MNWRIVSVFGVAAFGICAMLAVALPLALIVGEPKARSTIAFSSIENDQIIISSDAAPCDEDKIGACGTVLTYEGPNKTLDISIEAPEQALQGVTSAKVQLCFSENSMEKRPWRDADDIIGEDRQCAFTACDDMTFTGNRTSCVYKVDGDIGTAVFFLRALLEDEEGLFVQGADNFNYFQIDGYLGRTTGIIVGSSIMSVVAWGILASGIVWERTKQR
eukprot:jgi/Pico_ML_1/53224/g3804.t1